MSKPPADASLLFGAIAESAEVSKRKNGNFLVTLRDVYKVDWFTDRPDRDAGTWNARKLIKKWRSLFGSINPNAQIAIESDGEKEIYSFEMLKPNLDKKAGELSFKTKPIGQKNVDLITGLAVAGREVDSASLFIDDTTTSSTELTMTLEVSFSESDFGLSYTLESECADVSFGSPTASGDGIFANSSYGTIFFGGSVGTGTIEIPVTITNGIAISNVALGVENATEQPAAISFTLTSGVSGELFPYVLPFPTAVPPFAYNEVAWRELPDNIPSSYFC